jgi:hypothetical protein
MMVHPFGNGRSTFRMPIFKYFVFVGSVLLVIVSLLDAYFGDDERDAQFNGSFFESALYAPRFEETISAQESHFTRDATPAARVKEVFSQFIPNEGRRAKRYSSAATLTQ